MAFFVETYVFFLEHVNGLFLCAPHFFDASAIPHLITTDQMAQSTLDWPARARAAPTNQPAMERVDQDLFGQRAGFAVFFPWVGFWNCCRMPFPAGWLSSVGYVGGSLWVVHQATLNLGRYCAVRGQVGSTSFVLPGVCRVGFSAQFLLGRFDKTNIRFHVLGTDKSDNNVTATNIPK